MSSADETARAALRAALGVELTEDEPLSARTSFRIGGPAAFFHEAASPAAAAAALAAARRIGLPVLVLGGGTNLLVADAGFDGLALRPAVDGIALDAERRRLTVGAGVATAALVEWTLAEGLAGLEFAAGLPGTVGGAVAGNAGCFGGTLGERLVAATVILGDGALLEVGGPEWFAFGYRGSAVAARGAVVAAATFAVAPGDRARLAETAAANVAVRREKHPPRGARTAGSYFKNLPPERPGGPRRAAGALLDAVGAKGMRVGDAAVFPRHANIIVNEGAAAARDVLALADMMRGAVRDRFGVELVPEVRYVG